MKHILLILIFLSALESHKNTNSTYIKNSWADIWLEANKQTEGTTVDGVFY
jgi:hypothetical protein